MRTARLCATAAFGSMALKQYQYLRLDHLKKEFITLEPDILWVACRSVVS